MVVLGGIFITPLSFADDDITALQTRIAVLEERVEALERKQEDRPEMDAMGRYGHGNIFDEMDRMRRMFDDDVFFPQAGMQVPTLRTDMLFDDQVDIKDEGDSYVIMIDIPGMAKDSLEIEARGAVLIISGKREEQLEEEQPGISRRQSFLGAFSRSLSVPPDADTRTFDVDYADNMLKIRLKKGDQGIRK